MDTGKFAAAKVAGGRRIGTKPTRHKWEVPRELRKKLRAWILKYSKHATQEASRDAQRNSSDPSGFDKISILFNLRFSCPKGAVASNPNLFVIHAVVLVLSGSVHVRMSGNPVGVPAVLKEATGDAGLFIADDVTFAGTLSSKSSRVPKAKMATGRSGIHPIDVPCLNPWWCCGQLHTIPLELVTTHDIFTEEGFEAAFPEDGDAWAEFYPRAKAMDTYVMENDNDIPQDMQDDIDRWKKLSTPVAGAGGAADTKVDDGGAADTKVAAGATAGAADTKVDADAGTAGAAGDTDTKADDAADTEVDGGTAGAAGAAGATGATGATDDADP